MIIEIFTYTDEVIALLFQVLTNEFRAVATWAVCVQFYGKNLLRQPIHIQGCSREVALFTHVEQPFACKSDIIEFQKSQTRVLDVLSVFSPPVDVGAVSSNREPSVVANNYCCSKSDARTIALSCCRHHMVVRIEVHGVAFPSSHQCRHLIDARRHFANNLLNGHSRPPSIKVGFKVSIAVRQSIISYTHIRAFTGCHRPPRQISRFERRICDKPRGIHGVFVTGAKQSAAVLIGVASQHRQGCHHAEHG